jgi:hypothetical protein
MRDSEDVEEIVEARLEAEPLLAAPPPPPKPRFFGPHFWTGFGFGVLALIFLLFGGGMVFTFLMMRTMKSATGSKADGFLSAPPFPAAGAVVSDFALGLEKPDGTPFDAGSVARRSSSTTGRRGAGPAARRCRRSNATFILGPDGRVAFSHTGAARWDDDSALAFLRSLPAVSAAKP